MTPGGIPRQLSGVADKWRFHVPAETVVLKQMESHLVGAEPEAESFVFYREPTEGGEQRSAVLVVAPLVNGDRHTLIGIDVMTGSTIWSHRLPEGSGECARATPVLLTCLTKPSYGSPDRRTTITIVDGRNGSTVQEWLTSEEEGAADVVVVGSSTYILGCPDPDGASRTMTLRRYDDAAIVAAWETTFDVSRYDTPCYLDFDVSATATNATIESDGGAILVDLEDGDSRRLDGVIRRVTRRLDGDRELVEVVLEDSYLTQMMLVEGEGLTNDKATKHPAAALRSGLGSSSLTTRLLPNPVWTSAGADHGTRALGSGDRVQYMPSADPGQAQSDRRGLALGAEDLDEESDLRVHWLPEIGRVLTVRRQVVRMHDLSTGNVLWRRAVEADAQVVVGRDFIIVAGNRIVVWDADGTEIWSTTTTALNEEAWGWKPVAYDSGFVLIWDDVILGYDLLD